MGSYPMDELSFLFPIINIIPARILFIGTLLTGTLIAASSSSWFSAWLGLELNLMSFIPIITSKTNIYSSERALKYFLIQALGSAVLLITVPLTVIFISPVFLVLRALILKVGAAPLHFWFPTVMQGISWPQAIVLITVQKIAPIVLMINCIHKSQFIIIFSCLSALVGGLRGLNQLLLRKIIAYSSINHLSWILASMVSRIKLWLNYFLIYCIVSTSIALIFHKYQIFHLKQITKSQHKRTFITFIVIMSLFSLGGLPPFLGFIPKMIVISQLAHRNALLWLTVLLFRALLTLFFYLRIILTSLTLSSVGRKIKTTETKLNKFILYAAFINFVPLFTPMLALSPF